MENTKQEIARVIFYCNPYTENAWGAQFCASSSDGLAYSIGKTAVSAMKNCLAQWSAFNSLAGRTERFELPDDYAAQLSADELENGFELTAIID